MMAKHCEICGRPIKTGRKYCWEHRNNASEGKREEKIIDNATVAYHQYIIKKNDRVLFSFFTGIFFVWLVAIVLFRVSFPMFIILAAVGLVISFIASIYIAYKFFGVKPFYYKKIEQIDNKSPEYIDWVKEWVKQHRKEQEFRKSLLK